MPLGEILEKAFRYPWKNKALWFYGLLLALFSGISSTNRFESDDLDKLGIGFDSLGTGVTILLVVVVLIFATIAIIVSAWAITALIKGSLLADKGKRVDRKEIGKVEKKTIWEVIKLTVVTPFLMVLALILIIIPFVILFAALPQPVGGIIGVILGIVSLLALIPLLVYLSLIWTLSVRELVVNKESVINSLKKSRNLMRGRGWKTFLVALVLGAISGMATFFAFLPLLLMGVIAMGFFAAEIYIGALVTALFVFAYLIAFFVFEGYVQAFVQVAWTLWWSFLSQSKEK